MQFSTTGNIEEGRPNLGPNTSVAVYRLMAFALRDVLIKEFGEERAREIFVKAGLLAGKDFCKNLLNKELKFNEFIAELQKKLENLNMGILRIEKSDMDKLDFIITVSEDLDCSGIPVTGSTVCDYDEGFFAGVLGEYTGKSFYVKEVDCWASGGRVCRFKAKAI